MFNLGVTKMALKSLF